MHPDKHIVSPRWGYRTHSHLFEAALVLTSGGLLLLHKKQVLVYYEDGESICRGAEAFWHGICIIQTAGVLSEAVLKLLTIEGGDHDNAQTLPGI